MTSTKATGMTLHIQSPSNLRRARPGSKDLMSEARPRNRDRIAFSLALRMRIPSFPV